MNPAASFPVAPLAKRLTGAILDAAGRRLRLVFEDPEYQTALEGCVKAGMLAMVQGIQAVCGDEGRHSDRYLALGRFFTSEEAAKDLGPAFSPLLQGRPLDLEEIEELMIVISSDPEASPGFDFRPSFTAFTGGFAAAVRGQALLREELKVYVLYERTAEILLAGWESRLPDDLRGGAGGPGRGWLSADAMHTALERMAFEAHERQEKEGWRCEGAAEIPGDDLLHALAEHLRRLDPVRQVVVEPQAGILHPGGTRSFRFPHRTFQEYLAARYLLKQGEYEMMLTDRVRRDLAWWRDVFLLAAGASRETPRLISDLVDHLIPHLPGEVTLTPSVAEEARLAAQALEETRFAERATEGNGRFAATVERVRHWLVAAMRLGASLDPPARARCGRSLARLGDPRRGVTNAESIELCLVPAGPFWMGGDETDDERPRHLNGHLDYDYWMTRYPVTVAQFRQYESPHELAGLGALRDFANLPVSGVSRSDAQDFCRWLTRRLADRGALPAGFEVRLPSEAEWEKAARGGIEIPARPLVRAATELQETDRSETLTANPNPLRRYPWGEDFANDLCNGSASNIHSLSPVGCFPEGASVYGCEDLSGNLQEWTRSLHSNASGQFSYPYDTQDGREDPDADAPTWVLRGGTFDDEPGRLLCTSRFRHGSEGREVTGFRVVAAPALDITLREFAQLVTWGKALLERCRLDGTRVISARSFGPGRWLLRAHLPLSVQEDYGTAPEALILAVEETILSEDLRQARREVWDYEFNVDLDLLIVVEDGPRLDERLGGMFQYGDQWVAWSPVDGIFPSLIDRFRKCLPVQDIFERRDAVRGNQVIGRAEVISDLSRRLAGGQAIGVFGLRKIGKTTTVRAVTDRLDPISAQQGRLPVGDSGHRNRAAVRARVAWLDAGHVQERTLDTVAHLLRYVLERRLSAEDLLPADAAGSGSELTKLRNVLESALSDTRRPLVLVIDEYDLLFEGSGGQPGVADLDKLFQMLRAFAQETSRLALAVIGRDPMFFERPEMEGRTNPMLGWFVARWLGPLPPFDADTLLTKLGRRVALEIGPLTRKSALDWSGGHPMLHREFGSALLNRARRESAGGIPVSTDPFHEDSLDIFLDRHGVMTICQEVVHLLSSRYWESYVLLSDLACSDAAELGAALSTPAAWHRPAIRILRDFGLLLGTRDSPWIPRVLQWYLHTFESQEKRRA